MTTDEQREQRNARNRRHRRRKRLGLKVYRIELDGWHIKQLKQAGLIADSMLNDPELAAEALSDAMEQLLAAALDGAPISGSFWSDFKGPQDMAP